MKIIKITLIIVLLTLLSCESRNDNVKTNWKYMKGYHFGDFLSFKNENIKIHGDTIYRDSHPYAIIENFEKTFLFGTENKLTLKNIETGELGFYTSKGK